MSVTKEAGVESSDSDKCKDLLVISLFCSFSGGFVYVLFCSVFKFLFNF